MAAGAVVPVSAMASAMARASTSTLHRTIKNSYARIAKGLTGAAKLTELNRIKAASIELQKRGAGAATGPALTITAKAPAQSPAAAMPLQTLQVLASRQAAPVIVSRPSSNMMPALAALGLVAAAVWYKTK